MAVNMYRSICRSLTNTNHLLQSQIACSPICIQDRNKSMQIPYYGLKNNWPEWTMMKDQRKRMTLKEYGPYKLRYNAIRKAEILPLEIREIADQEIASVPVDASYTRIVYRCRVTSKPRGTAHRFCLGRHLFRHLADYNKLSGVQRAMW